MSNPVKQIVDSAGNVLSIVDYEARNIIAPAYNTNKTYTVGEYCIYNNKMYKCTTSVDTPGSFNPNSWLETTNSDELSELHSSLALTQKIYRFLSSGNVAAGNSFAFTTDYTSDNDIYVDTNDNTKIKFTRSGIVRVSVHIAASPVSGATNKRAWLRLVQGTTIVANLIQYGEYTSQSVERIMSVSSSVPVSIQATESVLLNAGGTSPSYIEVQWIS